MNLTTTRIRTFEALSIAALILSPAVTRATQPLQLVSVVDPALASLAASGDSAGPIVSADGRYVLFSSTAENLALVGTNSAIPSRLPRPLNAYARDTLNGTTTLVSVDTTGLAGGDADSMPQGISTNNRYALFEGSAGNLVPGDTNAASDVFVRDLQTGTTILVSANTNGAAGNGGSQGSAISPDGRFVVFASSATDLVPGDTNGLQDVFIRDMQSGLTRLVSVGAKSTRPTYPSGASDVPLVTPDGRFVAFSSSATNLAPGVKDAQAGIAEIYVRDVVAGTTTWASSHALTALSSVMPSTTVVCFNHAISEDGQFVVYEAAKDFSSPAILLRYHVPTGATLLIHTNVANASVADGALDITPTANRVAFVANIGDTSGFTTAVMVWDAETGTFTLASEPLVNDIPDYYEATAPVLDRSGRYVAYLSNIPGLVTNQVAEGYHAYVRDLQPGGLSALVDVGDPITTLDSLGAPALSADGQVVAFTAPDGALVPGDHNDSYDIFVRDLVSGTNGLISLAHSALQSITPNNISTLVPRAVSADGRWVAFRSLASDLASDDSNWNYDVFVRDLEFRTNELISVNTNGAAANGNCTDAVITPDGRFVAFTSYGTDLVPGLSNNVANVFVRDRLNNTTILVSVSSTGAGGGNYDSTAPMISSDGRFVFFYSMAGNLVPGYAYLNGATRLYMRDLQTATTHAVTPYRAFFASMTPDGRLLACTASSRNLSSPPLDQIYVWDSIAARRVYTNGVTFSSVFGQLALSPNGQLIAYATNVTSSTSHLYALDWAANTNWLIAPLRLASQTSPRFSADSRFLAYAAAQGTTPSSTINQVYLYDFDTGSNLLLSRGYLSGTNANGNSDNPEISPDGRFVAYESNASDLVPGDTNGWSDIFLYDRLSGSTTLLSVNRSGTGSADRLSVSPALSPDGQTVVFQSWATDLLADPRDFNNDADIFACRIISGDVPIFQASLSASSEGLLITWPVLPGKSYRVQFKDNLGDPLWQDVPEGATVLGNQGSLYQPASVAQRFYRVVAF